MSPAARPKGAPGRRRTTRLAAAATLLLAGLAPLAAAGAAPLEACRIEGVEHEALCGSVRRALDPARPRGVQIDVQFVVLPALARRKKTDPVLVFAGGPGQSAIALAGPLARQLGRFANRRDVVLIDQRGTGRSAPLQCELQPPTRPLAETVDTARQIERLRACRAALQQLPYGDLAQFSTPVAMADVEAVRQALGAGRVNLIGVSYGTRAALEYMRQFPQAVRRAVLDGVAPPDMVLPASFSTDNQAAMGALLRWCETDAACAAAHPALRAQWQALLARPPHEALVRHPLTGAEERVRIDRDALTALVRAPLYAPGLASALPQAIAEAAQGRHGALFGLAAAMSSGPAFRLAEGMHFSVVCAEDVPRTPLDRPGADFGEAFAALYRAVCVDWPRAVLPAAFYALPPAPAATLLLSGAIDPATPPRHAERVARALGAKALHVVAPNAGHGVMGLPCMRDVVFRFVDAETDEAAIKVETACVAGLPRPLLFGDVK